MWGYPGNTPYIYGDFLVVDQRGFSFWIQEMATPFESSVLMNERVTRISYGGDKAIVRTDSGLEITGDYVICTLPLGVLQSRTVEFDPPFAEDKLNGIDGMTMGKCMYMHQYTHSAQTLLF
jgi:monoamine oxidase